MTAMRYVASEVRRFGYSVWEEGEKHTDDRRKTMRNSDSRAPTVALM